MVQEAEANADADQNVRKKLNFVMKLTNLYSNRQSCKDLEGKVDAAEVAKATEAKEALQAAIEKTSLKKFVRKRCFTRNRTTINC